MKTFSFEGGIQNFNNQLIAGQTGLEPNYEHAFIIAAIAAARGHCRIKDFPRNSQQPNFIFVKLFQDMNIAIRFENSDLIVDRSGDIRSITVSLGKALDLLPTLSVLLSKAQGKSLIFDIPQDTTEDINLLFKTSELLNFMKVPFFVDSKGLHISELKFHHHEFFVFDPGQDHRLAFAAALAKSMGYRMRILNSEVVNKSLSGFWNLISGGP